MNNKTYSMNDHIVQKFFKSETLMEIYNIFIVLNFKIYE